MIDYSKPVTIELPPRPLGPVPASIEYLGDDAALRDLIRRGWLQLDLQTGVYCWTPTAHRDLPAACDQAADAMRRWGASL